MTDQSARHRPTDIGLHHKSRLLSIVFDDGVAFELPYEYLRVFSKAAEVRTLGQPVTGKEAVDIEQIEPQGQYGVRILFDDGHDTGIYSWDTLYALGVDRERNWAAYLKALEQIGYQRQEPQQEEKRIKLLYFNWLAQKLRKETEELVAPPSVVDLDTLLVWLGRRKPGAAPLFDRERVRVTLNKQFAEGFSRLHDGDEVGIIPTSPTAPATPDLV
nr:gamma-butyrobetaine hydroxylase-like domain-containing protein [Candidatus Thiosymbion oneisti]